MSRSWITVWLHQGMDSRCHLRGAARLVTILFPQSVSASNITIAFTGLIANNSISGATFGVAYSAGGAFSDNLIFNNNIGVIATVAGSTNGFGFVGSTAPNQIYNNQTGVQLIGQMQNQHIYDNTTG